MDSQKLPTGGSADNHEGHNDPSSSIDGLPPAYSAVVADNGHGENHAAASSNGGSSIPAAREKQAGGPEDEPPPAYTETYGRLDISEDGMGAQAEIAGLCPALRVLFLSLLNISSGFTQAMAE
jgi:hypothetical protein